MLQKGKRKILSFMKKQGNYFPHYSNARYDPKIINLRRKYTDAAYAWFFMILEIIREQPDFKYPVDQIGTMAFDIRVDIEVLTDIVHNSGLFVIDNNLFFSQKFIANMQPLVDKSARAIEANRVRWEAQKAVDPNGDPNGDPRKKERKKENNQTIKERKDLFIFNVKQFSSMTTKDKLQNFIIYWTTLRKDGKMYFEMQPGGFDIKVQIRLFLYK